MTWPAGTLPDPYSVYYRLCPRSGTTNCWEAPLAYERVIPEGGQDQGWLRLSMSAWGPGDYLIVLQKQVYVDFGWGGAEGPVTISNWVLFHIP